MDGYTLNLTGWGLILDCLVIMTTFAAGAWSVYYLGTNDRGRF